MIKKRKKKKKKEKKEIDNFADIGLAVGTPAGFAPRHVSSVCVGLANGTKRTPSQNWENLLSELHVPTNST